MLSSYMIRFNIGEPIELPEYADFLKRIRKYIIFCKEKKRQHNGVLRSHVSNVVVVQEFENEIAEVYETIYVNISASLALTIDLENGREDFPILEAVLKYFKFPSYLLRPM